MPDYTKGKPVGSFFMGYDLVPALRRFAGLKRAAAVAAALSNICHAALTAFAGLAVKAAAVFLRRTFAIGRVFDFRLIIFIASASHKYTPPFKT
jgi:hypothetical protein